MEVSNNTVTSELLLKMAFRIPANVPGSELSQETHMPFNDYFTEDAMFLDPVPDTLDETASDKTTTPPTEYGLTGGADVDYDTYEQYPSQHVEKFGRLVLENVKRSDTTLYRLTTSYTRYDASGNSLLRNAIQFNYGDGSSYDYFLFIDGELIEKGDRQRNWYFDVRSGYITFYGTAPVVGQTLELTFVRYIGKKSISVLRNEIDASYQVLDGKLTTLREDTSLNVATLQEQLDDVDISLQSLYTKIDVDVSALRTYVDSSLASLNTSVEQLVDDVSNNINISIDGLRTDISAIQTEKSTTFEVNSLDVSGDIDFKGKLYNDGVEFLNYTALDNCGNNLLVKGHLIPDISDTYTLGTLEYPFRDLYLGPQSLYVNGVPIIQDRDVGGNQREMVITTSTNQNLVLQTSGSGAMQLKSTGSGALTMVASGADATLESNGGDVNVKSTTGGVRMDSLNGEIALNASSNIQLNPNVLNGYAVRVNAPLIMGYGHRLKGSSEPLTVDGEFLTKGRTTISGEMIVQGNFTVTGNTSYLDTTITRIRQDILTLNGGNAFLSSGTLAGIKINRGEEVTPYFFAFEEGTETFKIGEEGAIQPVLTREDTPVSNGIPFWNNTEYRVNTTSDITYDGSSVHIRAMDVSTLMVDTLDATTGTLGSLDASSVDLNTLTTGSATITNGFTAGSGVVSGAFGVGSLDASSADVDVLAVGSASISGVLDVSTASVSVFTAETAGVASLDASSASLDILTAGTATISGTLYVAQLDLSGPLEVTELDVSSIDVGVLTAESASVSGILDVSLLDASSAVLDTFTAGSGAVSGILDVSSVDVGVLTAGSANVSGDLDVSCMDVSYAFLNSFTAGSGQVLENLTTGTFNTYTCVVNTFSAQSALIMDTLGASDFSASTGFISSFTAGTASVSSALNVSSLDVSNGFTSGTGTISGALNAGSLDASSVDTGVLTAGTASVSGVLDVSSLDVSHGLSAGTANVSGALNANSLDASSVDTGVLTAGTGTISGALDVSSIDVGVLTAETATVNGVLTISSELIVNGNFTVAGTTSYLNTDVTQMKEDLLVLNAGNSALSSGAKAGIQIDRGEGNTPYLFVFQEGTETFRVGQQNDLQAVATREDAPTANSIPFWDSSFAQYLSSSNLTYNGTTLMATSTTIENATLQNADISAGTVNELTAQSIHVTDLTGTDLDISTGTFDTLTVQEDLTVDGQIYTTGMVNQSDARIKRNITDVSRADLVDKFRMLKPVEYSFASYVHTGKSKTIGFIAQDVEQVFPDYVTTGDKEYTLSNDPTKLQTQLLEIADQEGIDVVEENGRKKAVIRGMRNIDKTQLYETMVPVVQHVLQELDKWQEEKRDILERLERLERP